MDFFLDQNNIIVVIIALVSGAMLVLQTVRKGGKGASVNVQDAIQLANREHGIFIDIRSPEQFKTGSIPQSRNIPSADLESKAASLPKNKPIILVCDTGQKTGAAVGTLRKLGFERVVSIQGGLRSWTQDGLPLSKKN